MAFRGERELVSNPAFVPRLFRAGCATMKRLWIGLGALALLLSAVPGHAQVLMGGDIGFVNCGSRLRLFVEHITNLGDETTDKLRIRIWGTKDSGDHYFEGRLLSAASIPRVFPHQDFDDLRRTFRLFDPPT